MWNMHLRQQPCVVFSGRRSGNVESHRNNLPRLSNCNERRRRCNRRISAQSSTVITHPIVQNRWLSFQPSKWFTFNRHRRCEQSTVSLAIKYGANQAIYRCDAHNCGVKRKDSTARPAGGSCSGRVGWAIPSAVVWADPIYVCLDLAHGCTCRASQVRRIVGGL